MAKLSQNVPVLDIAATFDSIIKSTHVIEILATKMNVCRRV